MVGGELLLYLKCTGDAIGGTNLVRQIVAATIYTFDNYGPYYGISINDWSQFRFA